MIDFGIDLGIILQGLVILLIAWVLKGIANINGSVRELHVWKKEHTRQDDERHENTKEDVAAIWRRLDR